MTTYLQSPDGEIFIIDPVRGIGITEKEMKEWEEYCKKAEEKMKSQQDKKSGFCKK